MRRIFSHSLPACGILLLGVGTAAIAAHSVAHICRGPAPAEVSDLARAGLSPAAIEYLTTPQPFITEENMETELPKQRERLAAALIKMRGEAEQYKGTKTRSEPGVLNAAAIEAAFVVQDLSPAERLEYFNWCLTQPDKIIHVAWHVVLLKETQDDQGSLVEVKVKPSFVGAKGAFGMIKDHCVETWRYSDGKLTFVKLVPGENTIRGVISN